VCSHFGDPRNGRNPIPNLVEGFNRVGGNIQDEVDVTSHGPALNDLVNLPNGIDNVVGRRLGEFHEQDSLVRPRGNAG
jgi:hypothetical protein